MQSYEILKDLAIIVIAAKFMGILARKCKAPQVVGEIIAGLIIGPCVLGLVQQSDFLVQMAEIGVILLMFSASLCLRSFQYLNLPCCLRLEYITASSLRFLLSWLEYLLNYLTSFPI